MANERFAEKQANAQADAVIEGFGTFTEIAVQKEMEKTVGLLQQRPKLLFGVRHALQSEGLASLLEDPAALMTLESLASDGALMDLMNGTHKKGDATMKPGPPPPKRRKIAVACKRIKHLVKYVDVVVKPAFQRMEPDLFDGADWPKVDLVGMLAWAVGASPDAELPSQCTDKGSHIDDLID
eukprot:9488796-Pyramimonas_sp.AAC.1